SSFGDSVTFTATVTAASNANGTPVGSVAFKDSSTTLATVTLPSNTACQGGQNPPPCQAQVTYTTTSLSVGSHSITAAYTSSNNNAAAGVTETTGAQKANQTISWAAIADRRLDQSPFTPTAPTASSGLTTFTYGSSTPGVCTMNSGGVITLLTAGTCTVTADQ